MSQTTTTTLLLSRLELAGLLDISPVTLDRMRAAGKIPRPFSIGAGTRNIRWRRSEIEQWVSDGFPECKPSNGR